MSKTSAKIKIGKDDDSLYSFTAFGMFGFLIYGFIALVSKSVHFNLKFAFGVLFGMFAFETIMQFFYYLFKRLKND